MKRGKVKCVVAVSYVVSLGKIVSAPGKCSVSWEEWCGNLSLYVAFSRRSEGTQYHL